jgi:hypothetical protein
LTNRKMTILDLKRYSVLTQGLLWGSMVSLARNTTEAATKDGKYPRQP